MPSTSHAGGDKRSATPKKDAAAGKDERSPVSKTIWDRLCRARIDASEMTEWGEQDMANEIKREAVQDYRKAMQSRTQEKVSAAKRKAEECHHSTASDSGNESTEEHRQSKKSRSAPNSARSTANAKQAIALVCTQMHELPFIKCDVFALPSRMGH